MPRPSGRGGRGRRPRSASPWSGGGRQRRQLQGAGADERDDPEERRRRQLQAWGFGWGGQPEHVWPFAVQPPQPPQDRSKLPWKAFLQACKAALRVRNQILASEAEAKDLEPAPPTEVLEVLPLLLFIGMFDGCPGRAGAV